jgi:hypothetical protein
MAWLGTLGVESREMLGTLLLDSGVGDNNQVGRP